MPNGINGGNDDLDKFFYEVSNVLNYVSNLFKTLEENHGTIPEKHYLEACETGIKALDQAQLLIRKFLQGFKSGKRNPIRPPLKKKQTQANMDEYDKKAVEELEKLFNLDPLEGEDKSND